MNKVIGPQELVSEITCILLDACNLAEIKPVRNKNSNNSNNKPWFDKDCQKLKNSIKRNCRKLRHTQQDSTIVQAKITTENKQLKKLIKKKEKDYKLKTINEMNLTGKNKKYFGNF